MIGSLRWRLQVWHALVLTAVVLIFAAVMYPLLWQTRLQQIDSELDRTAVVMAARVRVLFPLPSYSRRSPERRAETPPSSGNERRPDPPPLPGDRDRRPQGSISSRTFLSDELEHLFDSTREPRWYFTVWGREGNMLQKSDSAPEIEFPDLIKDDLSLDGLPKQTARTSGSQREVIYVSTYGTHILVGKYLIADIKAQHAHGWLLFAIGCGVLSVGLAGGWVMSGRAIRPIAKITAAAESISAKNLSQRIDQADTDDEFGQLAAVLNRTFDRLQSAFETQKRFTADASHELRTPLSVILTQVEHAIDRERTPAEYKSAFEACDRAGRRMKSLINSLLVLARFDSEQTELSRSEVDVARIAEECIDLLGPLADECGLEIRSSLQPVRISADRQQLIQVVTNLLSNAISFSRERGVIDVIVESQAGTAVIRVKDTGVGISESDLPYIFERFYRVDKSRSRADGGSGLGLAICQSIVQAHHGSIEASSQLDVGTTFEVRLPQA